MRSLARSHSDRLWVHGFRFYFTPLSGFFSPFPHGTSSLSVAIVYLALEGGPPGFPQDFSCPAVLSNCPHRALRISSTGLSPSLVALPSSLQLYVRFLTLRQVLHLAQDSTTTLKPQQCKPITWFEFRLFPVRSPLLRESQLISFPPGT